MVLVNTVREYINRMFQDISGMKILILDSATVRKLASLLKFDFSNLYCLLLV